MIGVISDNGWNSLYYEICKAMPGKENKRKRDYLYGIWEEMGEKSLTTFVHSLNVARKARMAAPHFGLKKEDMYFRGGVHDVGKLAHWILPLLKDGKILGEEYKKIKGHVYEGARMLLRENFSDDAETALYHHSTQEPNRYPEVNPIYISRSTKVIGALDAHSATSRFDGKRDGACENRIETVRDTHPYAEKEVRGLEVAGIFRKNILKCV